MSAKIAKEKKKGKETQTLNKKIEITIEKQNSILNEIILYSQ